MIRTIRSGLWAVVWLVLAEAAHASGWIPLFDGQSFNGWTKLNGDPVRAEAWQVVDGEIRLDTSKGRGGNIVTDRDYGDFELVFEWKISERGNSGIKYRVKKFDRGFLGCEYQIIDDLSGGRLRSTQTTAALYDVAAPRPHQLLKPPGEYNRGRIVVCGQRIEHWLNGFRVVNIHVGSRAWQEQIAQSKFSDVEGFGQNRLGRIMLTDHGDDVSYRSIYLRPLTPGHSYAYGARRWTSSRAHRGRLCRRPLFRRMSH